MCFARCLIGDDNRLVDFFSGSDNETYSGIFKEVFDRSNNNIISIEAIQIQCSCQ